LNEGERANIAERYRMFRALPPARRRVLAQGGAPFRSDEPAAARAHARTLFNSSLPINALASANKYKSGPAKAQLGRWQPPHVQIAQLRCLYLLPVAGGTRALREDRASRLMPRRPAHAIYKF